MKISVVMLTCNGGPKLKDVVEKLSRQQVEAEVELIAVDSQYAAQVQDKHQLFASISLCSLYRSVKEC